MAEIRITSIEDRFRTAALQDSALSLLRRASSVGLLPEDSNPIQRLDLALIRGIARQASKAGVGQAAAVGLLEGEVSSSRLLSLIDRLDDAIVESPLPSREIGELARIYGLDGAASLLGVAEVSLRRYLTGLRPTPDEVAARAHFVALVSSDLAGSYNQIGLRRWWDRPRAALDGLSPRKALGTDWNPSSEPARAVATLAESLVGSAGAT